MTMSSLPADLAALAAIHRATLTSADLRTAGVGRRELERWVTAGALCRVGRGAYVDGAALRGASPEQAHVLTATAVSRTWPQGLALSHDSAALLHGLPLLTAPDTVRGIATGGPPPSAPGSASAPPPPRAADPAPPGSAAVPPPAPSSSAAPQRRDPRPRKETRTRKNASATIHRGESVLPTQSIAGCTVVAAAEAVFGVAALHGVEAGLVTLDAALHRTVEHVPEYGAPRPPGTVYLDELATLDRALLNHSGHARFRQVRLLADPRCESPGESRTRWLLMNLGYRVRSQVEVRDSAGRLAGRVDFALEDEPVAVEFDGTGKYTQYGHTVARDKARDQAMQRCGYEPVHLLWAHLRQPETVRAMVEHARERVRRHRAA